ncbi:MAG TPA: hypothetical protein VHC91_26375 [Trinickia sp.]|uniref:DUF7660 family protein n=1 Tax=Trinickia sp. TaxID=2571163 RepID=UPI002BDEDCB5|nr:hypothetical protein [Trinickia sp.]HVW53892.1 hypothetical protein [Trinickia sp.]
MTQTLDLVALLGSVKDEASFIAFVDALASDFAMEQELEKRNPSSPYGPGALGWENGTVDSVLSAAAAWGHASSLRGGATSEPNPWKRCAMILYAGKWYE